MNLRKLVHYMRPTLEKAKHNPIWSHLKCSRFVSKAAKDLVFDENFIKSHTVISNDHLTPELSLRLITPKCEMWFSDPSGRFEFENDPFWSIYWPGGQALSRYILDNKATFIGKNVIDIGSGCGASAIAAAKSGANVVVANDIDELSLKAIKLNAELNEVDIFTEKKDLIGRNVDSLELMKQNVILKFKWDIILIGDMFYDSDFSIRLFTWLSYLNSCGKTVFIGDPGRHAMKDVILTDKLVKVADYPVRSYDHYGFSSFSVWKMC